MDATTQAGLKHGFDKAAVAYAASRPGYPDAAVRWLVAGGEGAGASAGLGVGVGIGGGTGGRAADVLDLGAGSGSLTVALRDHAGLVVAVEPSPNLLTELRLAAPGVPPVRAGAESLPFADDVFDVVTVATAFHWFEPDRALPEIARVLRPGGHLALVWNTRLHATPWTRRLDGLLRSAQPSTLQGHWGSGSVQVLDDCPWFAPPERADFEHEQLIDRTGLTNLVASRSYVIALDQSARSALLDEVAVLFDAEAGADGTLALPYRTECFRSAVRRP